MEHAAMTSAFALLAVLAASAEAPEWFRVYQYAARPESLRGCSECQGEPDDVCEVRPGVQGRALDEYMRQRSPAPGRVKLLRSKADPDCAVHATAFFGPRGTVELVAIRLARAPPSAALVERYPVRFSASGWPRAPQRRKALQTASAQPDRQKVRTAVVCWGSERGWPLSDLGAGTSCEWWLLPVKADGEPDLSGTAFALVGLRDRWPELFRFRDPRWPRAFDRAAPLDDSILLGEEPSTAEVPIAPPAPPAPSAAPATARCAGESRVRAAVLDRFDQWEAQVVGARRSLNRASWTLDTGAWSGHCQELDVLRSALEQQLGCALGQEGRCVGAGASREEAR
jgi:hypothetical protein